MFSVGEHVTVSLPTERRRGVLAIINQDTESAEVLLFADYKTEQVDDQSDSYGPIPFERIRKLCDYELTSLSAIATTDGLRTVGAQYFKNQDWRGAIAVYTELLDRMERSNIALIRDLTHVYAVQFSPHSDAVTGHRLDPTSSTSPTSGPVQLSTSSTSLDANSSRYVVCSPVELQAQTLLNLGRAFFNAGLDGIDHLTYAGFIASLIQDPCKNRELRSKSFYWRSKWRLSSRKLKGALRDVIAAQALAVDDGMRRECELLHREVTKVVTDDRRGTRTIARELMKIAGQFFEPQQQREEDSMDIDGR